MQLATLHQKCIQSLLLAVLLLPLLTSTASAKANAVSLGYQHSCALTNDNHVKCWGSNKYGQLGNGSTTDSYTPVLFKLDSKDIPISVAAGTNHTCVLLNTGTIKCAGDNSSGQLGSGKTSTSESTPVTVTAVSTARIIAAGASHSCAVLTSGKVNCWGGNTYGQLGNGSTTTSSTPVEVKNLSSVSDIAIGYDHSCALLIAGTVSCWGNNNYGQLGTSVANGYSTTPIATPVKGTVLVLDAQARKNNTITTTTGKKVQTWGMQKYYAGSWYSTPEPTAYYDTQLQDSSALATGQYFQCALSIVASAYQLKCWGENNHGQLGLGYVSTGTNEYMAPTVSVITDPITAIAAGMDHACAVITTGQAPNKTSTLKCWGNNTSGQLGIAPSSSKTDASDATIKYTVTPTTVAGLTVGTASSVIPSSPVACTYTYQDWTTCSMTNGAWQHTRVLTSAQPAGCVGTPLVVEKCTPPLCTYTYSDWATCQSSGTQTRIALTATPMGCTTNNPVLKQACTPPSTMDFSWITSFFNTNWFSSFFSGFGSGAGSTTTCTYTYSTWGTCTNNKQARTVLTSTPTNCTGTPSLSQACTSPTAPTLPAAWAAQKTSIESTMTDLVKSTLDMATARATAISDTQTAFETTATNLLAGTAGNVPTGTKIAASKTTYNTALQTQKNKYDKLNTALVALLKLDPTLNDSKPIDTSTRDAITQIAMVYLNSLFTIIADDAATNSAITGCSDDPIQNQHIYKSKTDSFNTMVQCLELSDVFRLEKSLSSAFALTRQIILYTHPNYFPAIQDQIMANLLPFAITLNEATRFKGSALDTFLKLYVGRLMTTPDTGTTTDTGIQIYPTAIALYNPTTSKFESLTICSVSDTQKILDPKQTPAPAAGELAVWNDKYKCAVIKNLLQAIVDPAFKKGLSCSFWNTARLGKACQATALPKISSNTTNLLSRFARNALAQIEDLIMPSAYADTADCTTACAGPSGPCVPPYGDSSQTCQTCTTTCKTDPTLEPKDPPPPIDQQSCVNLMTDNQKKFNAGQISYKDKVSSLCQCFATDDNIDFCSAPYTYYNNSVPCSGFSCKDWWALCKNVICPKLCKDGLQSDQLACSKTCGNKTVDDAEECDDGNTADGDGCNSICKKEVCGNSKLDKGEECDDGNTVDGDKCSSTCKIEKCTLSKMFYDQTVAMSETITVYNLSGVPSIIPNACPGIGPFMSFNILNMDGKTYTFDEFWKQPKQSCGISTCGPLPPFDGKARKAWCTCYNKYSWDVCLADGALSCTAAKCGNTIVETGEDCDDGNTKDGDGCSSACKKEKAQCGNGKTEDAEECDDAANNSDSNACTSLCKKNICGDGKLLKGTEECDDGNTKDGDGCSSTCKWCPECDPSNKTECTDAKSLLDNIFALKATTLTADVTAGNKVICKTGMPASCEYGLYRNKCEQAINQCKNDNKCTGDSPTLKDLKDKICPNASTTSVMLSTLEMMKATQLDTKSTLNAFLDSSPNATSFRNDGADKLNKLAPLVFQWLQYYTGDTYTDTQKADALGAALNTLQRNAQPKTLSSANADAKPDASSDTGYVIHMDPKAILNMTPTAAAVTGAHEGIHVLADYLVGDKNLEYFQVDENACTKTSDKCTTADIAFLKATADAKEMDMDWYNQWRITLDPGFTEHWVMEKMNQSLGADWMQSFGGATTDSLCQGWTP